MSVSHACGAQNDRPEASRLTIACLGPLLRLGLVGGRVVRFLVWAISAAFRPRVLLIAENLWLRQQLLVLQRRHPQPRLRNAGPALLDYCQPMVWWLAWFTPHCETRDGVEVASSGLACLLAVTLAAGGFCRRPIPPKLQGTRPTDNHRNRLWGQKRIQAELSRLGFTVSARTVAKYMNRRRRGPSPGLAQIPEAA